MSIFIHLYISHRLLPYHIHLFYREREREYIHNVEDVQGNLAGLFLGPLGLRGPQYPKINSFEM